MKNLYLLLPGNPSVPGVYDSFINTLVSQHGLNGQNYAYILPHLGQCNQGKFKGKHVTIRDVLADHRHSIYRYIGIHKPTNITLIGHSFGSAMTIALYEEFRSIINHFVVLCPFLRPSGKNRGYLKMFKNPLTRFGMKSISHSILLNENLSERFFERWLGENPYNSHIPKEIKKPYYIKNFFSLVSEYIDVLPELNLDQKLTQMNPEQSFFLMAENDFWVPLETQSLFPRDASYKVLPDISHDFCLKQDELQRVSSEIVSFLNAKRAPQQQLVL